MPAQRHGRIRLFSSGSWTVRCMQSTLSCTIYREVCVCVVVLTWDEPDRALLQCTPEACCSSWDATDPAHDKHNVRKPREKGAAALDGSQGCANTLGATVMCWDGIMQQTASPPCIRWAAVAKGNAQQQHAPAGRLQLHARRRYKYEVCCVLNIILHAGAAAVSAMVNRVKDKVCDAHQVMTCLQMGTLNTASADRA